MSKFVRQKNLSQISANRHQVRIDQATRISKLVIGMTKENAETMCRAAGLDFYLDQDDSKEVYLRTCDIKNDRLNISCDINGVVYNCYIG